MLRKWNLVLPCTTSTTAADMASDDRNGRVLDAELATAASKEPTGRQLEYGTTAALDKPCPWPGVQTSPSIGRAEHLPRRLSRHAGGEADTVPAWRAIEWR